MSQIYNKILRELRKVEGVKMTALGSRDGFLMSGYENDESEERLTLMAAAMIRAAETAADRLDKEGLNRVIVDFNGGKLIAVSAGPKAIISVITAQDVRMDSVMSEVERTAGKIREII